MVDVCALLSALRGQKCIGTDMFSWIRHYVAEMCAPPSALSVLAVFVMFSTQKKSEYKVDADGLCIFRCFLIYFVLISKNYFLDVIQPLPWNINVHNFDLIA